MLSSTQPIALHSNENDGANVGTAKTPVASKPRRVFGDISNRKLDGHINPTTASKPKTPGVVTSKAPLQQLSIKKNAATLKSASKPQQKRVEFILPGETKTEESKPEVSTELSNSGTVETEMYPDIERPAGRLWSEQRAELEIHNGDYVGAPVTDISFEGAENLREEYVECQRKCLQALRDYELENEERCLQELYETSKRVVESDGALLSRSLRTVLRHDSKIYAIKILQLAARSQAHTFVLFCSATR